MSADEDFLAARRFSYEQAMSALVTIRHARRLEGTRPLRAPDPNPLPRFSLWRWLTRRP